MDFANTIEICGSWLASDEVAQTTQSHPATPDACFKTPLVSHRALIAAETNIL